MTGRASRRHAALDRSGDEWVISDLGSTNGIRQDGEARRTFSLSPGAEIDLGGVRLVAESQRYMRLRELMCRFIGWSLDRAAEVDRAMRAARDMANLRASLVLRGPGALIGLATRLHELVLGPDRPASVHAASESGMVAMDRALDGSLYFEAGHLPADIREVLVCLRSPNVRVRLIVGASTHEADAKIASLFPHVVTISIPPLRDRADEFDRLLRAWGADAAARLGAPDPGLRPHDPKWLRDSGIATQADLEDSMRRMVALRNWGVTGGAERLGITHGALSRWARRRKIPT